MLEKGSYSNPLLVGALREDSCAVEDVPAGSWVKCNTDTLMELMSAGRTLSLREVTLDDPDVRACYSEDELVFADAVGDDLDIVSIEYVGEEEVQCIEVEDYDHMYITDDFMSSCNTSNIVFLKSTDDSMLDTLEKMSGKTHRTYAESKIVTQDLGKVVTMFRNEDKRTITYTTKEEPVISYNQMAFLGERQSIVFRASDPPVLNKNQMILPMSWRLFLNKIQHPGHDYTLQTIPTLSSAAQFDARKNLPQFEAMVDKRLAQACYAKDAEAIYREKHGNLDDYAVEQLDPDIYSEAVMEIIWTMVNAVNGRGSDAYSATVDADKTFGASKVRSEVDSEMRKEISRYRDIGKAYSERLYAGGTLCRNDLAQYDEGGKIINVNHALDDTFVDIFRKNQDLFVSDVRHFSVRNGNLYDASQRIVYIESHEKTDAEDIRVLEHAAGDVDERVFDMDSTISQGELRRGGEAAMSVSDGFYRFLLSQNSWNHIARGIIEREVLKALS